MHVYTRDDMSSRSVRFASLPPPPLTSSSRSTLFPATTTGTGHTLSISGSQWFSILSKVSGEVESYTRIMASQTREVGCVCVWFARRGGSEVGMGGGEVGGDFGDIWRRIPGGGGTSGEGRDEEGMGGRVTFVG